MVVLLLLLNFNPFHELARVFALVLNTLRLTTIEWLHRGAVHA
jgi:hypothetical protein